MTSTTSKLRLPVFLLLGALAFAAGLTLARLWLAEWQVDGFRQEAFFAERFQAYARQIGVRLETGEPRFVLASGRDDGNFEDDEGMDRYGSRDQSGETGRSIRVRVSQPGSRQGDRLARELAIDFSPSGRPRSLHWALPGWGRFQNFGGPTATPEELAGLARGLLHPGESLGGLETIGLAGSPIFLAAIQGSSPPEHLQLQSGAGGNMFLSRFPGTLAKGRVRLERLRFSELLLLATPPFLRLLAVGVLFVVLLSKGRIDVVNGSILAALTLAASLVPALTRASNMAEVLPALIGAGAGALWVFLIWSAGESFLRAADPSFTTSLDALRAGRLGPRGGRSLLYGLSLGAALAGLELAAHALAARLPDAWPESASVGLPVFSSGQNPFGNGIALAGGLVVVIAVMRRIVPPKYAPAAAILASAILLGPLRIHPYPLELAGNLAVIAPLILLGRRFGLTTLLTASLTSFLLPAAALSAWHLYWLPGTFVATAGSVTAILALGMIGLRRPDQVELERLKPPPFIRRLEEERRIRYEMGLLARMQVGLLPTRLPNIEGWEIAARSLLATEAGGDLYDFLQDDAGRLWIAAGDVAGHGYSCAIVHAMTTAALASLVTPERTPAEVLGQVDKVLRRGGHRNFASLVLMLFDPATGKALLSNAGHPYPLALFDGAVSEIEISGLPLGQGPARRYEDISIQIPPGGVLVFCSDGLFEAVDWSANPYGFDRPQEVLRTLENRSAAEIVEALLHDWQKHLRSEEPPDDTTVVVVKRVNASDTY
ncbi:MAG TPA: SpoIIE family protein phosphatase [Thermoanaerobaculia bacterium]|jgi:sigma-B regulation protein RsbU (phosphoserine phosphatase)|nr:SpoIIE family protein phosphatase [Thermoanaerobaculia bacterium]